MRVSVGVNVKEWASERVSVRVRESKTQNGYEQV